MGKGSRLIKEIWGVVIGMLAVLLILSLVSYDPSDRSLNTPSGNFNTVNLGGVVGAYLADFLLQGLGWSSYLVPPFLCIFSYHLFREAPMGLRFAKFIGYGLLIWSAAIFLNLFRESDLARETGGILGGLSKQTLTSLFGHGGTYLIALSLLLLAVMLAAQISLVSTLARGTNKLQELARWTVRALQQLSKRLQERREKRKTENKKKERREFKAPPIVLKDEAIAVEAPRKTKRSPPQGQEQFNLPEIRKLLL